MLNTSLRLHSDQQALNNNFDSAPIQIVEMCKSQRCSYVSWQMRKCERSEALGVPLSTSKDLLKRLSNPGRRRWLAGVLPGGLQSVGHVRRKPCLGLSEMLA